MARSNNKPSRRPTAALVRWHRRIGLAGTIFFVLLVATGMLLGHADRLGLTRAHADLPLVLAVYGLQPDGEPVAYRTDDGWVAWLDGTLFIAGSAVDSDTAPPLGAVSGAEFTAVASLDAVHLYDEEGRLVERLDGAALPGSPEALGRTGDGRLVLRAEGAAWRADRAMLGWERLPSGNHIEWVEPVALPAAQRSHLLEAWRGPAPRWDRVIADVHSGRILGPAGPWIVDVVSLALLVLAGTGLVQWMRRR